MFQSKTMRVLGVVSLRFSLRKGTVRFDFFEMYEKKIKLQSRNQQRKVRNIKQAKFRINDDDTLFLQF